MLALIRLTIVARSVLSRPVNPLLEALETDNVFTRLDAHSHLVVIVGSGEVQPVGSRAHCGSKDQVGLGDVTELAMAVKPGRGPNITSRSGLRWSN